jgi:hypothetical protein
LVAIHFRCLCSFCPSFISAAGAAGIDGELCRCPGDEAVVVTDLDQQGVHARFCVRVFDQQKAVPLDVYKTRGIA